MVIATSNALEEHPNAIQSTGARSPEINDLRCIQVDAEDAAILRMATKSATITWNTRVDMQHAMRI
ncbi:GD22651 [Drosophila simulans]|uniref:GD22651 n=1 Tax=Drosophila simulans TaxID=7240 RepID=B4Q3L4_DROSI|nr:GD22651 [Drosophila simulans]